MTMLSSKIWRAFLEASWRLLKTHHSTTLQGPIKEGLRAAAATEAATEVAIAVSNVTKTALGAIRAAVTGAVTGTGAAGNSNKGVGEKNKVNETN